MQAIRTKDMWFIFKNEWRRQIGLLLPTPSGRGEFGRWRCQKGSTMNHMASAFLPDQQPNSLAQRRCDS